MIRLLRSLLPPRCLLCRERTRHLAEHVYVNHAGETP